MSDEELCRSVVDELQFDPSIGSSKISIQAEKGVVTLMGRVSSFAEKIAAQNAARSVRGVPALADELEVRCPNDKKTADDKLPTTHLKSSNGMSYSLQTPFRLLFKTE